MSHDPGVGRFHDPCLARHVRVHVNDGEEIETKWRCETTEKSTRKQQRVLIGLMVVCKVIIVQDSDPKKRRKCTTSMRTNSQKQSRK